MARLRPRPVPVWTPDPAPPQADDEPAVAVGSASFGARAAQWAWGLFSHGTLAASPRHVHATLSQGSPPRFGPVVACCLTQPSRCRSAAWQDGCAVCWQPGCRFPGSPAGLWPHDWAKTWVHCVFVDRYERVNVWSHALPAVAFAALAVASTRHNAPLAIEAGCAAAMHAASAAAHAYPDSKFLEKLDHLGIVLLMVATPFGNVLCAESRAAAAAAVRDSLGLSPGFSGTPQPLAAAGGARAALMSPGLSTLRLAAGGLVAVAFLPPVPRSAGFFLGAAAVLACYWESLATPHFGLQAVLYLFVAACFLRGGGHRRWQGCCDHHAAHYAVTINCAVQAAYLAFHCGGVPGVGWLRGT